MRNYVVILILLALLIASSIMLKREIAEKQRYKANYEAVVNDKKNAEILQANEISKYHKDLDSLRKILGIREKTVQTIFETKINYIDEQLLIPVYDTIPYFDTVRIVKSYSISKPCYDLQLTSINDTISEKLSIHDKFTGFLYWERPHKFWFIRWGVKQYFMKIQSECMGEIIPDKLIITN